MREVPSRPSLIVFTILAVAFFGGAGIGLTLAARLAPGSQVASAISFFVLPMAMLVGFNTWLGLAVIVLVPALVVRLFRGFPDKPPARSGSTTVVPSGAWTFVAVSSPMALMTGVVVGILSPEYPVFLVMLAYWAVGTAYGAILWRLARSGYLPFPDTGQL